MKSWPSVYIGSSGVIPAVSPKSYSKRPSVSVGQLDGSTATSRTSVSSMNGSDRPPRLEPPPHGAITTSGRVSPAMASCSRASRPMIVWCSSTWLRTEPSE